MALFYYYDQNPFCFSFHIQTNNKSPNLHKKAKPWKILIVVVKWRHHANGVLHTQ